MRTCYLRLVVIAACSVVALACEEEVTSSSGDTTTIVAECTVSDTLLDFGCVCENEIPPDEPLLNVLVVASPSNTVSIIDSVVLESCNAFEIIAGSGPYELAPGDVLVVTIRFSGSSSQCTLKVGGLCDDVMCVGDRGTCNDSCGF